MAPSKGQGICNQRAQFCILEKLCEAANYHCTCSKEPGERKDIFQRGELSNLAVVCPSLAVPTRSRRCEGWDSGADAQAGLLPCSMARSQGPQPTSASGSHGFLAKNCRFQQVCTSHCSGPLNGKC
mmetsp:Transcript_576/g.971  ORF Transcript_576/g.971 Transcript_576/m.971 type:complete len:126 (-) Transcript_576:301-678(-)